MSSGFHDHSASVLLPPVQSTNRPRSVWTPEAFTSAIREFDQQLRAYAVGMVGDAAEDVLQEAYLRAFRAGPPIGGSNARLIRWLYTIVHHCAVDEYRRAKSAPIARDAVGDAAHAGDEAALQRIVLVEALAGIPVGERAAVLLVDARGFSYREAACVLGISRAGLALRVRRGRQLLVEILESEEV